MKNVTNPTENDIFIVYGGIKYEVKAGETLSNVPNKVAEHWKTQIHSFITVKDDNGVPVEGKKETPEDEEVQEKEEKVEKKTTKTKK